MNEVTEVKEANAVKIKTKDKKHSGIASRMLLLMVIFIFIVFTLIFLSFNFYIADYVKRDSVSQLSTAVQDIKLKNSVIFNSSISGIERNSANGRLSVKFNPLTVYQLLTGYLQNRNENSEVNTIIYKADNYTRYFPASDTDISQNLAEMDNIVNVIKSNNLTEQSKIYPAATKSGNYYLTNIDLGSLFGLTGFSAVFYVSIDKYDQFIRNIYFMLFIILVAAMIFTILYVTFISRSISKPIKKLCSFADEIGHGNFKRNEYSFRDRELIDLNNRMNETAGKLEKNDEDQKIFFQNVSHELKTPLMSIKGYAEGIKFGVFASEKDMTNATDIIISESDRLNDLVADLLYISKMDAFNVSKNSEEMTKTSLVELAENCAEKLKGLLISRGKDKNKKIELIPPAKDIFINCNEESMMRAIMNVVANCVQYADTKVEISFGENEKSAFLYIRDDGAGIDEKDLPNIFKRFYKGKAGKHGIGLSITKSIIEQHGAKITAGNRTDNIVGAISGGAEFIIEFNKI